MNVLNSQTLEVDGFPLQNVGKVRDADADHWKFIVR
jgi:hypothetical protein